MPCSLVHLCFEWKKSAVCLFYMLMFFFFTNVAKNVVLAGVKVRRHTLRLHVII